MVGPTIALRPGGRGAILLSGAVDCDLQALTGKPRLSGALTVYMHVEALHPRTLPTLNPSLWFTTRVGFVVKIMVA
jgi:hypothetical protein